ncbi:MAG TPA: cystathionine gamma-lyase [Solirubrobacteraceae bacterium]|nr:cystathionine gamma-lyase [Solirubrobacteraceae bacterium]
MSGRGPSTRSVHAGLPEARDGEPLLPGPTFAAPYHLRGAKDASEYGYARMANPTWTLLERALGELEGGETLVFASGMAAVAAALLPFLGPGDVLVVPGDGYYNVRGLAREHLGARGVEVRAVRSEPDAIRAALPGASMLWLETPTNPELLVLDVAALAAEAHAGGAIVAVDNTLATPLAQRPLELGADLSVVSATKQVTGHGDLLLGYVAARDPEHIAVLRSWRTVAGAVPGPFEAWLAHRSLATLGVRAERQARNAAAVAEALAARADVVGVRWPGIGCVVVFDLGDEDRAQRFLDAAELVAEATSFGAVHTTAERRARWNADAVGPGFIRLSVGIEDTEDLLADLAQALDTAR